MVVTNPFPPKPPSPKGGSTHRGQTAPPRPLKHGRDDPIPAEALLAVVVLDPARHCVVERALERLEVDGDRCRPPSGEMLGDLPLLGPGEDVRERVELDE